MFVGSLFFSAADEGLDKLVEKREIIIVAFWLKSTH